MLYFDRDGKRLRGYVEDPWNKSVDLNKGIAHPDALPAPQFVGVKMAGSFDQKSRLGNFYRNLSVALPQLIEKHFQLRSKNCTPGYW
jgi:hypothetical protein